MSDFIEMTRCLLSQQRQRRQKTLRKYGWQLLAACVVGFVAGLYAGFVEIQNNPTYVPLNLNENTVVFEFIGK